MCFRTFSVYRIIPSRLSHMTYDCSCYFCWTFVRCCFVCFNTGRGGSFHCVPRVPLSLEQRAFTCRFRVALRSGFPSCCCWLSCCVLAWDQTSLWCCTDYKTPISPSDCPPVLTAQADYQSCRGEEDQQGGEHTCWGACFSPIFQTFVKVTLVDNIIQTHIKFSLSIKNK